MAYLNSIDWGCDSDERLFAEDIENRVRSVIKWSAASNGMESKRFITHSLRSGGSTSLYARAISMEHIRRFGRWPSGAFRRYLYRCNHGFRFIGSAMVKAAGLMGQLQMAQPIEKKVTLDVGDDDSDVGRFRVGGGNGRCGRGKLANPSPNTSEVGISHSDWETDSQCEQEVLLQIENVKVEMAIGGPLQIRPRSPRRSHERDSEAESASSPERVHVEELAPSGEEVMRSSDRYPRWREEENGMIPEPCHRLAKGIYQSNAMKHREATSVNANETPRNHETLRKPKCPKMDRGTHRVMENAQRRRVSQQIDRTR